MKPIHLDFWNLAVYQRLLAYVFKSRGYYSVLWTNWHGLGGVVGVCCLALFYKCRHFFFFTFSSLQLGMDNLGGLFFWDNDAVLHEKRLWNVLVPELITRPFKSAAGSYAVTKRVFCLVWDSSFSFNVRTCHVQPAKGKETLEVVLDTSRKFFQSLGCFRDQSMVTDADDS